ncbi:MAG: 4Fe-4S dicluster domain-containing protein [Proteobacteria bacterium]|nr:4Fe-4S dicluster domain-containing protein [Pseudomonadota bacterium]
MDKKRREFLKIAGISTLAGLGGTAVIDRLATGASPARARAAYEINSLSPAGQPKEKGPAKAAAKTSQRLGLVIDMRKFNANPGLAEKCIKTCDFLHNIPHFNNKKDEVKWVWLTGYENAFQEHSQYYRNETIEKNQVLLLCNQCDDPPCVRACPTKATFKAKNGIVAQDYHRCIGCRFCMAACPYGSRSFNWRDPRGGLDMKHINPEYPTRMRGVVEKCTMCVERVGIGKLPACVEATGDTKAMIFGDLNDANSEIRKFLKENYTIQRKPSLGTHPSVFYIV